MFMDQTEKRKQELDRQNAEFYRQRNLEIAKSATDEERAAHHRYVAEMRSRQGSESVFGVAIPPPKPSGLGEWVRDRRRYSD